MKKKLGVLVAVALLCIGSAAAQSAEKVSDVLESGSVTYGQACYFSAVQLGLVRESASYAEAVDVLKRHDMVKAEVSADEAIKLADFAFICCKTWEIENSLLYRIFSSPRYAFRQLQAEGIISSVADPSSEVSGHEMLNIISDCIDLFEGDAI